MRSTIFACTVAAVVLCASPGFAQLSGSVSYTGTESGSIVVEAFTEDQATFEKLTTTMANPGPFEFTTVAEGSYNVVAYIDSDDDARLDNDEIWVGTDGLIEVPPGSSDINLDLDTFVAGGDSGGDDEEDGCCAVVASDERSSLGLLIGLVGALLWRRRTF